MYATLRLEPHQWTPLPGTAIDVRWYGDEAATVVRHGEIWDLSPLVSRHAVLALARLRRGDYCSPPWPIMPLARRATYRSSQWYESMNAPTERKGRP